MLKKEFYYHEQTVGGRSLGFSAIFVPDSKGPLFNSNGDLMVWMGMTFCNKKDRFFNKKIARQVLREKPLEVVRVRDIPKWLMMANNKATKTDIVEQSSYDWIIKKFI